MLNRVFQTLLCKVDTRIRTYLDYGHEGRFGAICGLAEKTHDFVYEYNHLTYETDAERKKDELCRNFYRDFLSRTSIDNEEWELFKLSLKGGN